MISKPKNLIHTTLPPLLLSIGITILPSLFFLATISHLSLLQRYSYRTAIKHWLLFSLFTSALSPLLDNPLALVIFILGADSIFTLAFFLPVKRRIHTALLLGLLSGIGLITAFYFFLESQSALNMLLMLWNELMPLKYEDAETLRVYILYEVALRGVSFMVKIAAFIWFLARWRGQPTTRLRDLGRFYLSSQLYIFLAVMAIWYVATTALIQWSTIDIPSQFHFVWSNLGLIGLFILSLSGLALVSRWIQQKEWPQRSKELLIVFILIMSYLSSTYMSLIVQGVLGLIGLSFSKRRMIMQN
ncbi:hypothetical protein PVA45_00445 [Entomospira entomophila]|uniref:DUF2232 domain-containing protein n=1 Tax=Entomospira entomophila TaxID=2719988 RepID=A0A968KVM1_9SPIO|nr:hypothetical protein [Entomospira entomophilus]NIZ39990.1 hypothetical protein [Entomospira entomophilus]WDI35550.1 hypothetical protein PVA45_00445 [Entomospira entomophilus]